MQEKQEKQIWPAVGDTVEDIVEDTERAEETDHGEGQLMMPLATEAAAFAETLLMHLPSDSDSQTTLTWATTTLDVAADGNSDDDDDDDSGCGHRSN